MVNKPLINHAVSPALWTSASKKVADPRDRDAGPPVQALHPANTGTPRDSDLASFALEAVSVAVAIGHVLHRSLVIGREAARRRVLAVERAGTFACVTPPPQRAEALCTLCRDARYLCRSSVVGEDAERPVSAVSVCQTGAFGIVLGSDGDVVGIFRFAAVAGSSARALALELAAVLVHDAGPSPQAFRRHAVRPTVGRAGRDRDLALHSPVRTGALALKRRRPRVALGIALAVTAAAAVQAPQVAGARGLTTFSPGPGGAGARTLDGAGDLVRRPDTDPAVQARVDAVVADVVSDGKNHEEGEQEHRCAHGRLV